MLIKFYPPFDFEIRHLEMRIEQPTTVLQMLQRIGAEYTGFAAFLPAEVGEEAVRSRILVFVNGKVASLQDTLFDQDVIELVSPISGG
ncbi:MoaD/ThiS family protein [Moorella sp. ACPs]|jgi:sulfur carrier protein ThiS|uniref:MoaD/ThiS family protein n=1 Tax=Neomoorella carbonis TaxID=3062783 RepID=UPI00324D168B